MKSLFTARFLSHSALVALILCGMYGRIVAQQADSVRLKDYLPPDAESSYYTRFGAFGWVNLVTQTASFSGIGIVTPVIPSSPLYSSGTGIGFSPGVLVEFPFSFSPSPDRNVFGLSLRLSYSTFNATSSFIEPVLAYDNTTIRPTNVPIEYSLECRFNFLQFEPTLTYRIANGRLAFYAGVRAGLVLSSTFSYLERMKDPRYLFMNGVGGPTSVTFNEVTDKIPNAQTINLAPTLGVGYEIPLNTDGTIMLQPEGFWSPALFSLVNGVDWKVSSIRASLAVKYSPFRTIRPEMTPEVQERILKLRRYDSLLAVERLQNAARLKQTDSLNKAINTRLAEMKKVGLSATLVSVKGIDERGNEVVTPSLAVEEFRASRTILLLRAVFFEKDSYIIPARYRRIQAASRTRYTIPDVSEIPMVDTYRHILNILGKRLTENPTATIELIGHKSSVEAELLDERRAQTVSDYLQDVWRISAQRIVVRKAANTSVRGAEGEQFVEINSPMPEIFAPLANDFVATSVNPPLLRFGLDVNTGAGLKQWSMEVTQFNNNEAVALKEIVSTQSPPNIVEWDIADVQSEKPRSSQDITVQLSVTDVSNRNADAPINTIPVKLVTLEEKDLRNSGDNRWEETLLGQSPLFGKNIPETTFQKLQNNSQQAKTLVITGFQYELDKNRELAMIRAKEIAKLFSSNNAVLRVESVLRPGQQTITPEEPIYGQSVMIRVATPIKK